MPAPHPPEFRRRAIELARQPGSSVAKVAKEGLSTAEREELVQLRRDKRRLEMENEILKRASAYFVRENVLPN